MQLTKTTTSVLLGLVLAAGPTLGGETATYSGSGTYTAQKLTMTLGNGDIVFTGWNEGVAAISTDPPTLLSGKCARFRKFSRKLNRRSGALMKAGMEQVELVKRFRQSGDEGELVGLLLSINCVSAGLGWTG